MKENVNRYAKTAINWYPGHMAKAKRQLTEMSSMTDAVIEILDARVPYSSQNPDIATLFPQKPRLTLINKCSLADDTQTHAWVEKLRGEGRTVIPIDCKTGLNINSVAPKIRALCSEKLARAEQKGMTVTLRAMVVGVTNVGKSTFINSFTKTSKAVAEDRPGVTRNLKWIASPYGIDLLDTPGLLWPKFDDEKVGIHLACTGAIRDEILDTLTLSVRLCGILRETYPQMLESRYNIKIEEDMQDFEIFESIGRKRGMLISGGEINEERCATAILDEFRGGKTGKITLDILEGI